MNNLNLPNLGEVSDREYAEAHGIGISTAHLKRARAGIAPMHPRVKWTPEEEALLGTMSDKDVAIKIGKAQETVKRKRWYLKIEAYNQNSWQQDKTFMSDNSTIGVKSLSHKNSMKLKAKIRELQIIMVEQFSAKGLPIRKLSEWQVIEIAINELYKKHSKSKNNQSDQPSNR